MRTMSRGMIAAALLLLAIGATPPLRAQVQWNVGDVFVAIGGGQYNVYSNTGALRATIADGTGSGATAGCAFDSAYRLYTTNFTNTDIVRFSIDKAHGIVQTIPGGFSQSESVAFDGRGNFYVGYAGGGLEKYNHDGVFQASFSPTVENRGVDWIDVASDGQTIFYTSEGRKIFRFSTVTGQLPVYVDLSTVSGGTNGKLFAIRILPPGNGAGGVLVADQKNIKRVNVVSGAATIVQTYHVGSQSDWEALNLDPNGTSFWAGDATTHNFYRFNISTGNVEVGPINTNASLGGLCVDGAFNAAQLSPFPTPATQTFTLTPTTGSGGSNTVFFTSPITGTRFTATLANLTNNATVTLRDSLVDPSVAQSDPTVFSLSPGTVAATVAGSIPCDQVLPGLAGFPDTCEVFEFEASPNSGFSDQNFEIDKSTAVTEAIPNLRFIRNLDEDITDGVVKTPLIGTKRPGLCVFTVNQQTSNSAFEVCGDAFSSPAAGTAFSKNKTASIAFKFKVSPTGACPNGASPTNLLPLLVIARVLPLDPSTGTTPAPEPVTPIIVAGNSGGLPLFILSGNTWQLQVKTTNMPAGFTYIATMIDLTSTVPSISATFNLK